MMFRPSLAPMFTLCLAGGLCCGSAAADPAAEYLARRARTDTTDPAALMRLADFARSVGLESGAAEHYRQVLHVDPDHGPAYEWLVKIADNTPLPEQPDRSRRLAEEFGAGFAVHTTEHFLIVYNTPRATVLARGALLERAHDQFFSAFRRAGLRPLPLESRLVCVLFDGFDDYRQYALDRDGHDIGWSGGYYSHRSNRIAFFNDRTNPAFDDLRQRIGILEDNLTDLRSQIADASRRRNFALVNDYRIVLKQTEHDLNFARNRHASMAAFADTAKTTHEAVHQLAFNSGLQARGVLYPFWLTEGLACGFEPEDSVQPFGPHAANNMRLQMLRTGIENDKLMPLDTFIVMHQPPTEDADRLAASYGQAWALFRLLYTKRQSELRQYLQAVACGPQGPRSAEELLRDFEAAFGPLQRLAPHWRSYLKALE